MKKNGKKQKNLDFKKGTFFKHQQSTYMIIGFVQNSLREDIAVCMRVTLKSGRFNNKHIKLFHKYWVGNTRNEIVSDVFIDKRDELIFNEFVSYVQNTNFQFDYKMNVYTYSGHVCHYFNNLIIKNGNFSKFKKYSNKV